MTDLERFFQHLVQTLAATDPALLRQAIPFAEISGSIVPYRSHRRALQLDSSEDYEIILMRLGAGEGGYARLSPDEARQRLERELRSPNPNLDVLGGLTDAVVSLAPSWVAEALAAPRTGGETATERTAEPTAPSAAHEPPLPYEAPAELLDALLPASESAPAPEPAPELDTETAAGVPATAPVAALMGAASEVHCLACGEALPDDRRIKFCPYCGEGLAPAQCAACGGVLDLAWRFCATCGHPTGGRPVSRRRA